MEKGGGGVNNPSGAVEEFTVGRKGIRGSEPGTIDFGRKGKERRRRGRDRDRRAAVGGADCQTKGLWGGHVQ